MKAIMKFLAGGAAIAALTAAAPAAAQYYPGYGYGNPGYGYGNPGYGYGNPGYGGIGQGGYGYNNQQALVGQCVSAVQARLQGGYGAYGYGSPYGGYAGGRVLGVSRVEPRSDGGATVHGVASSGRYAGYGYQAQSPDLTWRCRTDFRGVVVDVDVNAAQPAYGYGNYTPYNNYNDYSQYGYRRY
jgi:hypothetical protein